MRKLNNIRSIGLISDTHVPSRAAALPAAIHGHFNGVDLVIHCGDIVDAGTITELSSIAPVIAVKGNMDPVHLTVNTEEVLSINDKFTICVSHGSGSPFDIKQRLLKTFLTFSPDIICYGHTHVCSDEIYNSVRFLNPGSPTAGAKFHSIVVMSVGENDIFSRVIRL
ncbi:MAG: metallophosphoesterase family protein [Candidatus Goldiibacteriota bacterium]|jgi:putative phosphoesterase